MNCLPGWIQRRPEERHDMNQHSSQTISTNDAPRSEKDTTPPASGESSKQDQDRGLASNRAMIDVLIITCNESLNITHCLSALKGWTKKVFVVDSGSTDGTQDLCEPFGAEVVHHDWEGYAQQKNWGLDNLPFESDWVLIVDADEVITSELRKRMTEIACKPTDEVKEDGFHINRLTYFLGRPIRHCGYYPSWNIRFFKIGKGRYEDRLVHEHILVEGSLGYIREPMLHDDRRGLEHYFAKHNRYSTLEARTLFREIINKNTREDEQFISAKTRQRRWVKRNIMPIAPFPGFWRFFFMYFIRLGILDGRAGLEFSRFISMYDSLVALKLRTLKRDARIRRRIQRNGHLSESDLDMLDSAPVGLSVAEGADPVVPPEFSAPDELSQIERPTQMQPESSPWTFVEKVRRALWMLVGKPMFRISFHNWYGFRRILLRSFGAKIGKKVTIRPTVNIEVPWLLDIEEGATIGDHAILYSLGLIKIGRRAIISQYAHLCAGTHDYTDHTFRLIRETLIIGDDVWIGADAFVGPGVHVHDLTVLGARSSTYKDLETKMVYAGNPARPLKERVMH